MMKILVTSLMAPLLEALNTFSSSVKKESLKAVCVMFNY